MTPESRARILFVALLLALAAGGAGWYLLAARQHATYEIRTAESVSGLIPGAPVEFHGVEVGKIREVRLTGPRSVRILADLQRGTPVTAATRAIITGRGLATRGFTGYVYVNLEDLGPPGAALAAAPGEPYPRIAAAPGQSSSLDTSIMQMSDNVQAVTALLRSTLDPATVRSLQQSLASIEQVSRTLAANNARLETMLANAEQSSRQLPPLLASSRQAVQSLQTQVLPQAHSAFLRLNELTASADRRLDVILSNSEQASAQLGPLLATSTDAVRSLQNEVLPDAQRTLMRIDHVSSSLDDTVSQIRRNPSVLVRGSGPGRAGPGEAR